MIERESLPLRRIGLKFMLFSLGLILCYIIFISLISIITGLKNIAQDGFWVPVLTGLIFIIACLWSFSFICRYIINKMKEKDIINNI